VPESHTATMLWQHPDAFDYRRFDIIYIMRTEGSGDKGSQPRPLPPATTTTIGADSPRPIAGYKDGDVHLRGGSRC
jgi:hypothetical protein